MSPLSDGIYIKGAWFIMIFSDGRKLKVVSMDCYWHVSTSLSGLEGSLMPDNEKKSILKQIVENPKQVIVPTTRSNLYDNLLLYS